MDAINRIKVVLAEKQKTNKWLAEAIGKNETTVSRWCTNESQPSAETFIRIAEVHLRFEVSDHQICRDRHPDVDFDCVF